LKCAEAKPFATPSGVVQISGPNVRSIVGKSRADKNRSVNHGGTVDSDDRLAAR
jgi:hypothetical protein